MWALHKKSTQKKKQKRLDRARSAAQVVFRLGDTHQRTMERAAAEAPVVDNVLPPQERVTTDLVEEAQFDYELPASTRNQRDASDLQCNRDPASCR